ncbi:LamG-like jellyroll fold domain-containing protein, partial [Rhodopirellula sallentina]
MTKRNFHFFRLEDRVLLSGEGLDPTLEMNPDADTVADLQADILQGDIDGWENDIDAIEAAVLAAVGEAPPQQDEPTDYSGDVADVFDAASAAEFLDPARPIEVVFVDASVDDSETLLADMRESGTDGAQWVVVTLESDRNGIEQITDALAKLSSVDAVHLVSHGDGEGVQLGNVKLDQDSSLDYAGDIASWGHAMDSDADLLIYGCDLASTVEGQDLIEMLALVCNCDVAASDDATGHEELGGDWILEYTVGDVTTDVAFGYAAQASWYDTLATITVTTTDDENDGNTSDITALEATPGGSGISLREAIRAANNTAGADTIVLGAGTYILDIAGQFENASATGDLDVTSQITITGDGLGTTILDASSLGDRIFYITNAADLTISDMTLTGASSATEEGAAVYNEGDFTATDVAFTNNTVGNVGGGAIYSRGTTTLDRTALIGNTSGASGGAIHVYNGTTTITNSTISGNEAEFYGGGIYAENAGSTVNIVHSTIADNTVLNTNGYGGGVYVTAATVNAEASIFADNTSNLGGSDIHGTIVSGGYNIIEHNSGFSGTVGTDILGSDPALAALSADATSGQSIHVIDSGSIAYNAATSSLAVEDQRGVARDGSPDIGAYEHVASPELFARYKFDAGSGATDSSVNGLNGVLQGDASVDTTTGTNQVGDGKLTLDGTGDYVDLSANVGSFANLTAGTISTWVKLSSSDFSTIFDISDGATSNFASLWVENGNLIWAVNAGGSSLMRATSTATINDDTWHHVAVTTDASGTSLFIDGIKLTGGDVTYSQGDASTTTFFNDLTGPSSVKLGAYDIGSVGGEFTGLMDDIRVYNYAVDESDMADLHAYRSDTPTDLSTTATNAGGLSINDDGGSDLYLLADDGSSILGGLSSLSYEVQFESTDAGGGVPLLSYATGSNSNEVLLYITTTGDLQLTIGGSNAYSDAIDYRNLLDGQPHSLGFTWDGGTGEWVFYVDGEVADSRVLAGDPLLEQGHVLASGGELLFGQEQDSVEGTFQSDQVFSGTFFNARVFDDARTEAEMAGSYRTELPFDESGMLAQWNFNDLSGDGVVTESVSGNNLTIKHTSESGFTASEAALTLAIDENTISGSVVGSVSGQDAEREARIAALLASDSSLSYNASTGKFYKTVLSNGTWTAAHSAAESTTLSGLTGDLVTIESASENAFIRQLATDFIGNDIWIGASDASVEGEWQWNDEDVNTSVFWQGDENGYAVDGSYQNWDAATGPNGGESEDYAFLQEFDGAWFDATAAQSMDGYVVQWDADSVLDATDALTYTIQSQTVAGAFAIDASTGTITVADGSLLNYESQASHSLTVRVTDEDSNTYDEVFTVSLNDLAESNNAPSDLSSGIELNTDGGNDAYLAAADADFLLGADGHTYEVRFSGLTDIAPGGMATFYTQRDFGSAQSYLAVHDDGTLDWAGLTSSGQYTQLLDGDVHSLAITWDASAGHIAFYVDGEYVESTSVASQAGSTGGDTFVLGQHVDYSTGSFDSDEAFKGTFHDFRVWDHARGAEEIALNHQQKLDFTPAEATAEGLMANWQFDGFNGSNEVVDIVTAGTGSENNLSIGHAVGTGFTSSTPVEDLHVAENTTNGSTVGFVLPSVPDVAEDIARDGLFNEATPSTTQYGVTGTFGDWTVTEASIDLFATSDWESPLGGRVVNLDGSEPGAIEQNLTTVAGRQYQVVFALTGDFSGGDAVKNLRVSASGTSADFQVTQENNWSWGETGAFEQRSFTFTADDATSVLQFRSLEGPASTYGPYIADVQVIEIPAAVTTILNDDPTLSYDAATGKFYKLVTNAVDVTTAMSSASSDLINGVGGQLVTIRSSYENELVQDIVSRAGSEFYIGGTDATSEGNWNWIEDGVEADNFWVGDELGAAPAGVYANFNSIEPNDFGGNEDYLAIYGSTGEWLDLSGADNRGYIIEWDASEVLSNFTFSLNDDAGGRFAIDSNTGEITVVDGSLLNHEASVSHNIDVTVSDAAGNSYNETMTVAVDDVSEAPTDLSVGVALNSDGGNDAYLVDNSSGVPYWDGLTGITMEFAISDLQTPADMATLYSRQSGGSGSYLAIHADGTLDWTGYESTGTYSQLFDGDLHTVAFSWDTPGGELRFYVDGVFAESIVTGTQANTNGGGAFVLGQDQDGGAESGFDSAQHFSGTFHDVRVWDHVRADSDIAVHDNYKLDFTSADAASAGLLANWQFDGFVSGEIVDIANGYVLTVGHATGTGYVAGAARDTLAVDEMASNGTQVGFAVAHDADANDTFNYTLLDSAGGRFAIDLNTGEITVADGSLLDFETSTSHDVTVQVMDSSGSTYNETIAITVNDVNDAPVMAASSPTYPATEDGAPFTASVAAFLGSTVTDADAGAVEGAAIFGSAGSGGTLEYSINGGSSWTTIPTVDSTSALLLRENDLIRFTPDTENGGTLTLDYHAWDQTSGTAGGTADVTTRGGSTAFSTADNTVTINVADVNDEQVISTNNGATFNEGSAGNTITSSMLETTDVDNTAGELTYTVTANPGHGQLKLDGLVTTSFTQSEIDAGRITYDHDDSENLADSFSFSVDDGAGSASTGSFSITLNPINDNIVAITSDGGGATASVNVNETVSFVTQVTVSDADMPGDTMTYSIIGGTDQGDFAIDASGNLTFVSSPDFESPDDSDLDNVYEVTVQVSDGVHTDSQTITVTVQDVQSTLLNVTTTSDVDDTGLGATYTIEELYAVGGGTDGEVSLREAITAANGTLGQDTINFSILNSDAGYTGTDGVDAHWQISLTASLPTITESVILDGTSQTVFGGDVNPGTLGVSNEAGTNDQAISSVERPEIAIVGASGFDGLVVDADNVTVQGFAMNGFSSDAAIYINDAVINTVIDSNVFGVAATSIADLGAALNNQIHVQSVGADNGILSNNILAYSKAAAIHASNASDGWSITGNQFVNSGFNYSNGDAIAMNGSTGGTVDGNYIAGSSTQAILLSGSTSGVTITDNTIVGNGVGPSSGSEVQFDAIAFRSGTNDITLRHNIIADNYGAGITVNDGAYDIEITENSIYGNGTVLSRQGTASTGSIGIDLQATGDDTAFGTAPYYTANDAGDSDAGGNSLQNFPVITQAVSDGTQIAISGTFNSTANETFTIELFTSASYANGYGQGETFLGSVSVTTDGSGNATFNTTLFTEVESGDLITATATNDTTKETSEFAAQFAINGPVYANNDDGHLEFDGTDDYVAIASSPELVMTNTMTMEAWVRPEASANTDRMILNKEGEYELSVDVDGSLKWGFNNTDPGWAWHDTNHVLTEGEWAHVAVTYDNGTVTTYVNGDVVGVYEGSGAIGDAHPTMDELHIGGRSNNPAGQYFQGGIDDVRIWNVARSQDEIRATIETPPSGSATGLVANYRFDGSGTTVTDYSGEGNDGVLGGGTATAEPTRSSYALSEDATLVISAANGLLANDADTDGDSITITEINGISGDVGTTVTLASGATVQLNADGSFDFDPGTVYQGLNDGESATDTFTYTVIDGNGNTDVATATITTTGINDAPIAAAIEGTALDYTEDDGNEAITDTLTLSDVDDSDLESATVSFTAGFSSTEDSLVFTDQNGITGSYDSGTGILTLSGTATVAEYQAALRSVAYNNNSQNPDETTRTVQFIVNDGTTNSVAASRDINVSAVIDLPVINNLHGDSYNYTEGEGPVLIDQGTAVVVTDNDSADFDTGTLTVDIVSGGDDAEDILAVQNQGTGAGQIGVSGSDITYEGTTIGSFTGGSSGVALVITLNANADATAVTALVQNITYENTDTVSATETVRHIDFQLTDGDGGTSLVRSTSINVGVSNNAPVITATAGGDTYVENGTGTYIENTLTITDGDSIDFFGGILTTDIVTNGQSSDRIFVQDGINVTTASNRVYYDSGSGATEVGTFTGGNGTNALVITFNHDADATAVEAVARQVAYRNLSDDASSNQRTIEMTVSDGDGGTSNTISRTMDVTLVNDAPTATLTSDDSTFTENGSDVSVFSSSSADTIEGTDVINSMVITVSDLANGSSESLIIDSETIELTDLNSETTTNRSYDVDVSITGTTATVTISKTGGFSEMDANAVLDNLRYDNTSENIANGTRTITLETITDDGGVANGGSDTGTIGTASTITVVGLNDDPYNDGTLPANFTILEDTLSDLIFTGFDLRDADGENGETLTIELTTATGGLLFASDAGGVTVTGNNSDTMTLSGTRADLNTFLTSSSRVQYQHGVTHTEGTASDTITVVANDNGNTGNGGGTDQTLGTVQVNITNINDAPTGSDNTITINEDNSHTFTLADFGYSDIESDQFEFVHIDTLPGSGRLLYNGSAVTATDDVHYNDINSGLLTYEPVADENGSGYASFTFRVQDDGGTANSGSDIDPVPNTITFDVTAQNDVADFLADNEITNSDFAMDLSGWTVADNTDWDANKVRFGQIGGANGSISQNFTTVIGETYYLTFDYGDYSATQSQTLDVDVVGGATLLTKSLDSGVANNAPEAYTFRFTADSTSTTLTFTDTSSDHSGVRGYLDNVEVRSTTIPTETATAYTENDSATVITTKIELGDIDDTDIESATVQVTGNFATGEDVLAATDQFGITSSYDSGTGTLTLSGTASLSEYETVLQSVTYANSSDAPDTSTRTISYIVNDGDGNSVAMTHDVAITAVNDTPAFNNLAGGNTFTEGGAAVVIDSDATIFDPELESTGVNNYDNTVLTIVRNGGASGDDMFSETGNLSAMTESGALVLSGTTVGTVDTNSNGTLELRFNGNANEAIVNEVLQSIAYSNTSYTPPTSVTLDYSFSDDNFGTQQGTGGEQTGTGSAVVNITAVNQLPVADLNGSDGGGIDHSVSFTEGDSAVLIADTDATITDLDHTQYESLGINLVGFVDGTDEEITIGGTTFYAGSSDTQIVTVGSTNFEIDFDGSGLTITRDGGGLIPQADLQSLLRTITYQHTGEDGTSGDRTLTVIPQDALSANASPGGVSTISVTSVNDAPVLDNSADLSLTTQSEDAGAPVGAVGTVITDLVSIGGNVTDVDDSPQTGIAITAADASYGTWWYTTDGGTNWNTLGSVSDSSARVLNANSNTRIYFESNADFHGTISDAITFRAWDRTTGSNGSLQDASTNGGTTAFSSETENADLDVTSVNDAPVLSNTSTILFTESFETPDISGLNDDDPTGWTSDSHPSYVRHVDEDSGDFTTPYGDQAIRVYQGSTVGATTDATGLNAPLEADSTYQLSFNVARGGGAVGEYIVQLIAIAGDNSETILSSVSGIANETDFSESGTITFTTDGSHTAVLGDRIAIRLLHDPASDYTHNVHFDNILLTKDAVTYVENGPAVVLDENVVVADAELDAAGGGSGNYAGAVLTLGRETVLSGEDVFSFADGNGISLSGSNLIKNSQSIATFDTVGTEGELTLTFTDANGEVPTTADVNNILQQITYANNSDAPPGSVQIDWTLSDGNGGSQGSGGALIASGSTHVAINNVNDAPVLDDSSLYTLTSITEDDTSNGGQTVASILASNAGTGITDADSGALEGIAIRSISASNGHWEFSTNGGSNWTDVGTVSSTSVLLLRDIDLVRFIPDEQNGEQSNLTFIGWDQTDGSDEGTKVDTTTTGGTTAFSDEVAVARITVSDVNDAPTVTSPANASVDEGGSLSFDISGAGILDTDDVDGDSLTVTVTADHAAIALSQTTGLTIIDGDGSDGTLQFSGSTADIDSALYGLDYDSQAGYNGSASLVVLVDDGSLTDTTTVAITVNPGQTVFVWDGGGATNDWTDADNWNHDLVPEADDIVVFDATSTKDSTLDAAFAGAISEIQVNSGYTGTLTLDRTLANSGDLTVADGTVDTNGQALDMDGVVNVSGGTLTIDGSVINLADDFIHSGGTLNANGSTLYFDGTGDRSLQTSAQIDNIEIDHVGTLTFLSDLSFAGDFTHSQGTVDFGGHEVSVAGTTSQTIDASGLTFDDFEFNNSNTVTIIGGIDVDGDLTYTNAVTINGAGVTAAGNITTIDSVWSGTSVLTIDGTGAQTISTSGGAGELGNLVINKASGTVQLLDDIELGGDFTYTSGGWDTNGQTVEFQGHNTTIDSGSATFDDVILNSTVAGTRVIVGTLDVDGDFTFTNAGTLNGGQINVAGDITYSDDSYSGTTMIIADGTGNQTVSASNASAKAEHLTINKASGTLTFGTDLTINGTLNHVAGSVADLTHTITFGNNSGTITASAINFDDVIFDSNYSKNISGVLNVGGDLTITSANALNVGEIRVAGNITSSDTSVGGNSQITLNGTGTQTISGDDLSDGKLNIDKTSGTAILADDLVLNGTLQGLNVISGTLDLNGHTINATGEVVVNDSVLTGDGTITNDLTVEDDAIIRLSASSTSVYESIAVGGTFTLGLGAQLELDLTGMTVGGYLQDIFTSTTLAGTFDSITLVNDSVGFTAYDEYDSPSGAVDIFLNSNPTGTISDVTVDEDAPDTVIDLDAAFSDLEHADNELTYSLIGYSSPAFLDSANVDNGAGTLTLDYAANQHGTTTITVRATDARGESTDVTFNVTVNSIEDAPIISGGPATSSLTETDSGLTDSGTFNVSDSDVADEVTAAVDSVAVSGTGASSVPGSLNNATLQSFLSVSPTAILDGTETTDTLTWNFNSGTEAFDFLADGETLVLTYTISATDDSGSTLSDTETVTVTITGTNDSPDVFVDTGDSAAESLTETDTTLTSSGTLTVNDSDLTDIVTSSVTGVVASSTTAGLGSNNAALLAMLSSTGSVVNATETGNTLTWNFNSGGEAFDYLANGESLTLTYTIEVTDSQGATDTQNVTITVNGTNDTPVITGGPDTSSLTETDSGLTDTGTLTISDSDRTDNVNAAVDSVAVAGSGASSVPGSLDNATLQSYLSVSPNAILDGTETTDTLTWDFNSGSEAFDFL